MPREVRERPGLRPGGELEFVREEDEHRVRKRVRAGPFARYRGFLSDLGGRRPDDLVEDARGE